MPEVFALVVSGLSTPVSFKAVVLGLFLNRALGNLLPYRIRKRKSFAAYFP
jgi:hypothetical protein